MKKSIKRKCIQILSIIIFTLVFPTTMTLLVNGHRKEMSEKSVIMSYEDGEVKLNVDDFLLFVLAAEYEDRDEEYMKMRCVMERTRIYKELGKKLTITGEELSCDYITDMQMKAEFAGEYNDNVKFLRKVIEDTADKKIYYKDSLYPIEYHKISSGKTKDLHTPCPEDVKALEYKKSYTFTKDELINRIGSNKLAVLSRCESDYVVKVRVGDGVMSGEDFAKALDLQSDSFVIKEAGEKIEIITKGMGNGNGISLHTAKNLSAKGESYESIIRYFYKKIEIND